MKAQTANLLRVASEDETILSLTGVPDMPAGQHAHAAIEKLFKALINEHGMRYQFIHDLNLLKSEVEALGKSVPVLPVVLGSLNKYATVFRYGDDVPPQPLNQEDCQEAVRLVREYVTARIQALGQPPPPAPAPTQP